MRKILIAGAAAVAFMAAVPASAQTLSSADSGLEQGSIVLVGSKDDATGQMGGSDYGPMGQCFDPARCGRGRGAYAGRGAFAFDNGWDNGWDHNSRAYRGPTRHQKKSHMEMTR
jgi:hypothetical protein